MHKAHSFSFFIFCILVIQAFLLPLKDIKSIDTKNRKKTENEESIPNLPDEHQEEPTNNPTIPEEDQPKEEKEKEPEPTPHVEKYITYQIPLNKEKYYLLDIELGSPSKKFNVALGLTSSSTWVPSINCPNCISSTQKYDTKESNSELELLEMNGVNIEEGSIVGDVISDKIKFGDLTLEKYPFISATSIENNKPFYFDGALGLGRPNDEKASKSFLKFLKENNVIDNEIFSIKDISDTQGEIRFGDQNKELIDISKAPFCKLAPKENLDKTYQESWICEMKYMISNKSSLYFDSYATFDPTSSYIYAPYEHLNYFETEVIQKIFENKCKMFNDNWEFSFVCKIGTVYAPHQEEQEEEKNKTEQRELQENAENEIEIIDPKYITDLEFILGNYGFKMNTKDLFKQVGDNEYELLIRFRKNGEKIWNLGHIFMKNYIIAFDNQEEKIYFEGENIIDYTEKIDDIANEATGKNYLISTVLALVFSFIIVIAIFIVICIKTTFKDDEKKSLVEFEEQNHPY